MRIYHYYNKTLVVINKLLPHSRDVETRLKAGKIGRSFFSLNVFFYLFAYEDRGSEKWWE